MHFISAEGTGRPFSFKQGDVIAVLSEDSSNKRDGWLYGEVQVNKTRGHFPADTVYIIPTVQPPPAEFLVRTVKSLVMNSQGFSTNPFAWAGILVQVTINRRLLIGRDDHLDQSEAYGLS